MTTAISLNRRRFLAGAAATALALNWPNAGQTETLALKLNAGPATVPLKADGVATPIWRFDGGDQVLRVRKGDELRIALGNTLPVPIRAHAHGIDGVPVAPPVAAGGNANLTLPLRQAGTMLLDPRLLTDGAERPLAPRVLVVEDTEPATVDNDEVLLIEEWRLRANNSAIAPGTDPANTTAIFTANGKASADFSLRPNARLRLRIVNGCARFPVGLRIANLDVQVMAIDGRPAEPFPARDGQLILAPGARADVFIDATQPGGSTASITLFAGGPSIPIGRIVTEGEPQRATPLPSAAPLPSSGLPAQLPFQNAIRAEIAFDGTPKDGWALPSETNPGAPIFNAKRGRVVMLTFANRAPTPIAMRLHGHHARLLDRLDDGWKPYWIDTLLFDIGQTHRIAFLAEYPGQWLVEAASIGWAARKLVRSFSVE